ncbi:hypothetical protein [Bacillus sp. 123MFChir2]|uniref:hypothetical protein n=1 Tax=Bacillus sp. 123MFChir2 TaxID=1169144 RepID=UPI0003623407|nr:hypothetical protein [Bacillus sp. 123MFChir2]
MEKRSVALALLLKNDAIMLANNKDCTTVIDRREIPVDSRDKIVWYKWNENHKENINEQYHIGYDVHRVVLWNEMKSWIHKQNGKNNFQSSHVLHSQTPEMVRNRESH